MIVMTDGSVLCDACVEDEAQYGEPFAGDPAIVMHRQPYSITVFGTCGGCDARATKHGLPKVIVCGARAEGERWLGHQFGSAHAERMVHIISTDDESVTKLRGLRLEHEDVVFLPGAEQGRHRGDVEGELESVLARNKLDFSDIISRSTIDFNISVTNNLNFERYQALLYGATPSKITGLT